MLPPQSSSRLPSNIPLRTLPSRSGGDTHSASTSFQHSRQRNVQYHDDEGDASRSDSSWTDTGDIGEQKGDEDDPLRLQLSSDVEDELLVGVQRRHRKGKKVRIRSPSQRRKDCSRSPYSVIDKEAIHIPHVVPPTPSRAARTIGFVMAGRTGAAHGLTGKALLYA